MEKTIANVVWAALKKNLDITFSEYYDSDHLSFDIDLKRYGMLIYTSDYDSPLKDDADVIQKAYNFIETVR